MFISFEGIDGCGKSTQIELLKNNLIAHKKQVLTLREPGGTSFAEEIREILLHSEHKLSRESELFLFESARADLVSKIIKPALNEGKIVLCDRFFDSTTAYQGYGRGLDVETIIIINQFATQGLKPDLTFYLHVSLETSNLRTGNKKKDKIENSGDGFFARVVEGYLDLCKKEPQRFIEINAEGNIEETGRKILKIIENKLL
ncbi:MAG: dTMP kinase [bacterium]